MKINFKFLIAVTMLSAVTFSCNDEWLQVNPYGSISQSTLANKAGVDGLLIGAYSLLDGGGAAGGNYTSGWTSLLAPPDARVGTESGVNAINTFQIESNYGGLLTRWRQNYAAVQRVNDVLIMTLKATDATDAEKLQFVAEARFLRGIYYLELATLFGNVPWIDETVNYTEGNYLVPNTAPIYPKIEADFQFAADNLTETKAQVGRGNSWAAKAFLVKTYLFQQKFAESKPLLDDIISNGQTSNGLAYDLQPNYGDLFKTEFRNGPEAVFEVQMSVNDGSSGSNGNTMDQYNGTFGGPATCCFGWYQATFDFVDQFQTDPTTGLPLLDTYINTPVTHDQGINSNQPFTPHTGPLDPRLDWTIGRRGIPYLDWGVHPGRAWIRNQFTSGPYSAIKNIATKARVATDRQGGGGYTNNPLYMIRFADVLLWGAEVEIEVGTLTKAEEYVNRVRARAADPDGFVKTYVDPANPTGGFTNTPAANYFVGLYSGEFETNGKSFARKAVRFERRLEMGMEHKSFLDWRRYDGNDFDQAAMHNGLMAREAVRPNFNPVSQYTTGVFIRDKHELFPIPLTEIERSIGAGDGEGLNGSVLVQNPGW